ncbi:MAG TPA: ATP-binding protein [Anaeromyxobacter sp.]|nr:ATP-binding protein [Anaeromyxobacter sp.]
MRAWPGSGRWVGSSLPPSEPGRSVALPAGGDLGELLEWFIRLRWLFAAALVLAALAGAVLRLQISATKALALALVVCGYNALLAAYHRLGLARPSAGRIEASLQIGLDLVALTFLIHFMGGATSPLVCLYLIHAIVAVMLLPRREAWLVGAFAFGLFLGLFALESRSVLPFHPLTGRSSVGDQATFDVVLVLTLLVTMAASMAITSTIMSGLRVRERQLQAAYADLREKQDQLVQNEKHASLGRLVAGIAHEINNPIQFIQGNMSFLAEAFAEALPILDAESAHRPDLRLARLDYPFFRRQVPVLLRDMAEGTERIGAIVRELRTYARRDEGRLDEDVDLGTVVQASVRLLHNQLKRVRLELDLDPALPPVRGNVAQIQQVVVNTLQNAYEALPAGDGRIAVRARRAEEDGFVRLSVEDDGCGIPPEMRDRIFDPFFTTKQASGGTGLGLAIIDGIIEQHRGRIRVESEVGKGTVFHFLLPAKGHETA